MVVVILLLLLVLFFSFYGLFFMSTAHKVSDDDLWLDEPSAMAAGDQEVVDIALLLHELNEKEVKELDHEKRMQLRKQMKDECGHLVQTIMAINMLDPQEAQASDNIVHMEDFLNR